MNVTRRGDVRPGPRPQPDPEDDAPVKAPARTDLRLLVPAATAWALVAWLLGRPAGTVLAVAVGILGVAVSIVAAAVVLALARSKSPGTSAAPSGSAHRPALARSEPSGTPAAPSGSAHRPAFARLTSALVPLVALTGLAVALTLVALASAITTREAGPVRRLADERATVTVTGRVTSDPVALAAVKGRPDDASRTLVHLTLDRVDGRGSSAVVQTPVLVFGDQEWASVAWGSRVETTGRLAPADDPASDVVAVLTARGSPTVVEQPPAVARVAALVRARFAEATDALPADARGLLPGLVIGDTARTPADLQDAMLVAGMTHLSAVSGSNVAIVLQAALGLATLVGLRRGWRPVVGSLLLVAFVVLVRPEPSVLRAAAMGLVGLVGLSTSRRRAGIPALSAAVLVLLCTDPFLARSAGFALSTLATVGLLLFAAPWGEAVGRRLPRRVHGWGAAFTIPVAAQLMCAPVIVVLQGSVSLVSVGANLLAAPFVAPATVLGVGSALLSVVWPWAAQAAAWLAALPTLAIAWVARAAASAPLATVPWPATGVGAVLLAAATALLLLLGPWLVAHARRRPVVPAATAVLGLAAVFPTHLVTWPLTGWAFVTCDVGQGDGLVLATEPGHAVVVDSGPDPLLMDGCLSRLHVTVVDAVVLTHFHADHVEGLPGVLHGRTVRQILTSPVRDPPAEYQEVVDRAAAAGVPVGELYAGDDLAWPGLRAHVWWPARVIHEGSVPNNGSVVLDVTIAGLRLLLLGDVEREAAHAILLELRGDPRAPPAVDVLKVAHHGSANRDDALLALVHPAVAVVSVGADNDYGHPAASTVTALERLGARVYRTDLRGDVAVRRGDLGAVEVATLR